MIVELWQLLLGFAVGLVGGALYFGGLWLTVTRLSRAERPYQLLALSFVLRMGAVLTIFYLLLPLGWIVLMTAMAGVLGARQILLWLKGGKKEKQWTSVPMQPSSGSGE